jgi:hypothetical protein
VTWLRELGGHPNPDVRVRAASAVGVLATRAFDFVLPRIIGPWACDEDGDLRDSAAIALDPPAQHDDLRDVVAEVVQNWAGDKDQPLLQATAARTFGGDAGVARPTNALRQLRDLAEIDHIDVAIAVAQSLGELVMRGTAAVAGRVLTEITNWVTTGRSEVRLVGRLAFLRLTYLRGAPIPSGQRPDPALRAVPTLLVIAMRDARFVARLAALWSDGLNSADAHRRLGTSLAAWAEAVEAHGEARATFVAVLRSAASHPRTAAIIARAAQAWQAEAIGPAVLDHL